MLSELTYISYMYISSKVSQTLPYQLVMFSFFSLHAELHMHHCLDLALVHLILKNLLHVCFFFFNNWEIFAFQNVLILCHTSTGISHRYTHVPSLPNLPPIFLLIPPFSLSQRPCLSSPSHTANSHWLSILCMVL